MNRREFLRRIALIGIGAAAFPFFPAVVKASWYIPSALPGVTIRPTYLKFGPLENRFVTDCIVVHHIGMANNDDVSAETVHQWHLNNGWSGIGYHFVVHKNGIIERGRPLDAVGAHCWHHNATSIGINLVGNFEQAEPTTVQLDSAMRLIAELSHRYKLKPGAGTVFGHRDFNSTLCPGKNLYAKLSGLCASASRL